MLDPTVPVKPAPRLFLNRLSDLLFVLARVCNRDGISDVHDLGFRGNAVPHQRRCEIADGRAAIDCRN